MLTSVLRPPALMLPPALLPILTAVPCFNASPLSPPTQLKHPAWTTEESLPPLIPPTLSTSQQPQQVCYDKMCYDKVRYDTVCYNKVCCDKSTGVPSLSLGAMHVQLPSQGTGERVQAPCHLFNDSCSHVCDPFP
ncbi:unnamed protein product [Closterium sp. NIES-64]|nr:unnamed protein product [Closterium sp. NIES-64]CAI5979684.1 unnamed protein product [Closterium sp. NIES-64]